MPRVLVVTGLRASGKETTRKYLIGSGAYKDGVDVSDDILRPAAQDQGITRITDLLPLYFRLGTDYFLDRITQKVDSTEGKVVVSSVRELKLFEKLEKRYGEEMALLYLRAWAPKRFERRQARRREGDVEAFHEFLTFEGEEMKAYRLAQLLAQADLVIDNSGTKEELFRQLDAEAAAGNI